MAKGSPAVCKNKKRERQHTEAHRSLLIPSALVLLPENPSLIPEAGCGQRPQKAMDTMPYFDAKKYKLCIESCRMVIL